jgi:hypothetical protein
MSQVTKVQWVRLALAGVSVPALAAGVIGLMSCGPVTVQCVGVFAVATYGSFLLFGLPALGVVIHTRSLASCVRAGVFTAVLPPFLLSALSLFSVGAGLSGMITFASIGAVSGVLFWIIAFAANREGLNKI